MKAAAHTVIWTLLVALSGYASWWIANNAKSSPSSSTAVSAPRRHLKSQSILVPAGELNDRTVDEYSVTENRMVRLIVYQILEPDAGGVAISKKGENLIVGGKPVEIPSSGFTVIELRNPGSPSQTGRIMHSDVDLKTKDYEAMDYRKPPRGSLKDGFNIIREKFALSPSAF